MGEKKSSGNRNGISRREFIGRSSRAAVGMALGLGALEQKVPGRKRTLPRVVRSYDANATWWDYSSNYYFDFVDETRVRRMLLQGVRQLMAANTDLAAWTKLLGGRNQVRGKFAIKINCNNYSNQSNEIDATSPSINAVLHGLIDILGIPPGDIYVYDCSRPIYQWRIRDRVNWNVNFVQTGDPLAAADYDAPIEFRNIATQYCPKVLTQASHVIDLSLFKDHIFVLATMGFKNHFGTTKPGPANLHSPIDYNLSDLNATPNIHNKTRLIVGDALWGVYNGGPYGPPQQWETFPGGPTPNSIFVGQDPVATESVMIDYLIAEQEYRGIPLLSHFYLHDAMDYHHLGVHEHRDGNGNYSNIDYVELDLT